MNGSNFKPEWRKLQFFGNLHQEISRSWKQPFSSCLTNADFTNLVGSVEQGYTTLRTLWPPTFHPLWRLPGSPAPSFRPSRVGPLPPLSGSPTSRPVRQVWPSTRWPSFRPTRRTSLRRWMRGLVWCQRLWRSCAEASTVRVLGDTVGSLLQRMDPVPATCQSSTSLSINPNKDAEGFPSWWRVSLLPGLLDTPSQVCLSLHDTLLPLSHFIHEWERLPWVSLWVLHTIRFGYTLQFGRNPPRFDGVQLTVVNSAFKASVLQQELSPVLPLGLLHMRPFLWWRKELRLHPTVPATRLIRVSRSCSRPLLQWRDPAFLQSGVRMGAIHRRHMITTDASMTGWGAVFEGRPASGGMDRRVPFLAHKLPGTQGCLPGFDVFSPRSRGASYHSQNGQYGGCVPHKPSGRFTVAHPGQACVPSFPLVPGQIPFFEGSSRSGNTEPYGRFSVEAEAQAGGMDVEPSDGIPDLGSVWQSGSGSLCFSRVIPVPGLVLPEFPDDSGHRCIRPPVAKCQSVCVSANKADSGSTMQSKGEQCLSPSHSPILALPDLVLGANSPLVSVPLGDSDQAGLAVPAWGQDLASSNRALEVVGMAHTGPRAVMDILPVEVQETIASARAPATRKLYSSKWGVFESWCLARAIDPVNCPVGPVLEFLQERLTAGAAATTLRVYVAAIAARRELDEIPLGRHRMVSALMRGVRRLRPVRSKVWRKSSQLLVCFGAGRRRACHIETEDFPLGERRHFAGLWGAEPPFTS